VAWGPWEYDLILLAGSADGCVTELKMVSEDTWEPYRFAAHEGGVNAISWAPATSLNLLESEDTYMVKRFVSSGADNLVKVWTWIEDHYEPVTLDFHKACVRDVAWCPSLGTARDMIASCGEDFQVVIWTKSSDSEKWRSKSLLKLNKIPIWRCSWSIAGNVLAISAADNVTRLMKENPDETWELVSTINENGQQTSEENIPTI